MARRNDGAHGGGHGWFVTFADLMGLLVSFFVMLVAFSNQDSRKMQAVAGSMREAFGVQDVVRYSGLRELDGLPTRPKLKNVARIDPLDSSLTPTPDEHGSAFKNDRPFALAVASLRQALKDLPELAEASKHIEIQETREGLNVELIDQDGRSMFPQGSKEPYERLRRIIHALATPLRAVPYRISITGHTAAPINNPKPGYRNWQLSIDRANAARRILEQGGYPADDIYQVAGKGDTDPLFPDDPSMGPNRRITVTLMREAPPIPPGLHP